MHMHRSALLRKFFALTTLALGTAAGAQKQLEHFDFADVDFESKSLEDPEAGMGIYLPKGWDSAANKNRRYPLVVWLHGFGGFGQFADRGGEETLDALAADKSIPELIFVTYRLAGGRPRSTYMNGEMFGNVEHAIEKDLLDHLLAHYPVSKRASERAIMGVSVGGFGALKIAMRHPDRFGVVAAHSSPILPDDPEQLTGRASRRVQRLLDLGLSEIVGDPIDKDKWAAVMPMGLARNANKDRFKNLSIYFDAGTDDRYGFAPGNQELDKLMTEKGIAHTFRLVQGGGHAWGSDSMLKNLRTSFEFVGKAFGNADKSAGDTGKKSAGDKR